MDDQLEPPPRGINLFSVQWRDWLFRLYKYVFGNMNKDFYFEVARGSVRGHTPYNISAHNDDISTTIKTVGCYGSGVQYVYPSSATIDYISSDNAADTHEITIVGLDANYEEVIQTKTLTGTTPVAIDTPLFRVNFLYNDTSTATTGTVFLWDSPSGSGTEHTAGVPTTNSTIKAYINQSTISSISDEHHLSSVFTIPVNKTGYIVFGKVSVDDPQPLELSFWVRETGKVFKIAHHIDIKSSNYDYFFKVPANISGKSDIEVKCQVGAGTAQVGVHYDLILVDD